MEDYSVIIRTTGKAGNKYQRLLDSIQKLNPQPEEIIVVLPEGYSPPNERLGNETFYFCPKGMVIQRLYGIEKCRTKYALVTDDDIAFESDFVTKLYEPLKDGKYCISAGPLLEFFPKKGKETIIAAILGAAIPTLIHRDCYNTVLRTTGYSYNRINVNEKKLYETQSAPWTCFFANIDELRKIHFEDEMWLDMHGYSAHDDTCMFYKAWLCGKKAVIVANAVYQHMDARTSKQGINFNAAVSGAFNTYVFWHRFIYSQETNAIGRLWCFLCLRYYLFVNGVIRGVKVKMGKYSREMQAAYYQGLSEAKVWTKSKEYANLPSVKR